MKRRIILSLIALLLFQVLSAQTYHPTRTFRHLISRGTSTDMHIV